MSKYGTLGHHRFHAKHPGGICASCREQFHAGDWERWSDAGYLIHDECPEPTDLVLTLEDLPTMRRLTNLIKQTAENRATKYNSRTDLEALAITTFWKHTQAFIKKHSPKN